MKCPKCGFNSFDFLEKCKKCGSSTGVKPESDALYKSHELSKRYEEAKTKRSTEDERKKIEDVVVKQSEKEETTENVEEVLSLDYNADSSNHVLTLETNPIIEYETETPKTDRVKSDLAGFSTRSISLLIDLVIIFSLTALVLSTGIYIAANDLIFDTDYTLNFIATIFFFLIIVCSSYFVFLEGYGGKTIGKMIMGITVIGDDGGSIDIIKAFTRWAVSFFSASFFFIGFLWALFDSKSQTWHDKIAGTLVVKEKT
ncbi:MAG TPA: RDD family protein [Thermodesulfobacteriota bacterium]